MNDHEEAQKIVAINVITRKYLDFVPSQGTTSVEYVWVDDNLTLRSKTRYYDGTKDIYNWSYGASNIPIWIYNAQMYLPNWSNKNMGFLKPVVTCYDPFRLDNNVLTLCETFDSNDNPTAFTKNRNECKKILDSADQLSHGCEFEIEQEFALENRLQKDVGQIDLMRKVLECFYRDCNYAGLSISSFDIENHPTGLLSYKIGPCDGGLRVSDELWISRYILKRVAEEFHLRPYFTLVTNHCGRICEPRMLCSFSTANMRACNDRKPIYHVEECIKKLRSKNDQDIEIYNGKSQKPCSPGFPEDLNIPLITHKEEKGCIVDARPRGDSDPYVVTKTIVTTACL